MNKQIVGVGLAVALTACGGGGIEPPSPIDTSGADVPATLTVPADGAKAAAGIRGFINITGGLTVSKSTTTTPCSTSGSKTFTSDDSTPNTQDGRTEFNDCISPFFGSERVIQDGVLTNKCHDTSANSQCQDLSGVAGENGVPLRFEIVGDTSDQRVLSLGASRETSTGDKAATGSEQIDNLINHKSATRVLDGMLMFSSAASGNRTAEIGGKFGFNDMARATANCTSGKLTVSTPQALVIDQNETFNGGTLHFTSDNGGTADVTFQPGGSISVSVNGSATTNFSASQLSDFCSIQ